VRKGRDDGRERAALFKRTVRIEITMADPCPRAVRPYVVTDMAAIAAIVSTIYLRPRGDAGWDWPNLVTFVLDDGRRIRTSIGDGDFGVHLPGEMGSHDYEVPERLMEAIGPHLMNAARNWETTCGRRLAPDATGGLPRPDG
jgi:hypothetical protein